MICRRSSTVCARNSTSSKIVGSGEKVTVVPGASRAVRGPVTFSLPCGLPPSLNVEHVVLAVAVDLEDQLGRQGVDDRDAHAVQAARDLVALAAELPAGVQHREHDLGGGLARVLGVLVDRDAAAVVGDPAAAVGQEVTSMRVQKPAIASSTALSTTSQMRWCRPRGTGRTDVHPGSDPDGFEALENRDVAGAVRSSQDPLVFSATKRLLFAHSKSPASGRGPHPSRMRLVSSILPHRNRRDRRSRAPGRRPRCGRSHRLGELAPRAPGAGPARSRSWVAQAGSSTATVSTPSRSLIGVA